MAVIIDFDKTLTKRDSLTLFTYFLWREKHVSVRIIFKLLNLSVKYIFKKIDNNQFKDAYFKALMVEKNEILTWFDEYVDTQLFTDNLNIAGHIFSVSSDDNIYIVTASPKYYVSKVFPKLKVLGGELIFDQSNFCVGYENCYATSKLSQLRSEQADIEYVFTDSLSDMSLIEACRKSSYLIKSGRIRKIYRSSN